MTKRIHTVKVNVGNIQIGHQNKVVIQSMTNTKTSDVKSTLTQINQLHKNGCELVRLAILNQQDVIALKQLVKLSPIPLIADIHYNNNFAIEAIKARVAKIRINPTNIPLDLLKDVVNAAKQNHVAIRIGLNQGSRLNDRKFTSLNDMITCALKYIHQFEKWGFKQIVVSLKSSNPQTTIELYELAANKIKYPLHIGVTEAGSKDNAIIKSVLGLAPILQRGIGDTIRISISGNPYEEPIIAKKLLSNLGLYKNLPHITSCPTCGRLQWGMIDLLNRVENYCSSINKPIKIAIMGCSVNGIGECETADVGLYGSKDKLFLYKKGKLIKSIPINNGYKEITKLIATL